MLFRYIYELVPSYCLHPPHKQPPCASVAINERMDMFKTNVVSNRVRSGDIRNPLVHEPFQVGWSTVKPAHTYHPFGLWSAALSYANSPLPC